MIWLHKRVYLFKTGDVAAFKMNQLHLSSCMISNYHTAFINKMILINPRKKAAVSVDFSLHLPAWFYLTAKKQSKSGISLF